MAGLFITGTDTGVGKTRVGMLLAHALRRQGLRIGVMKPAETGCPLVDGRLAPQDAMHLRAAADCAACCPAAPDMPSIGGSGRVPPPGCRFGSCAPAGLLAGIAAACGNRPIEATVGSILPSAACRSANAFKSEASTPASCIHSIGTDGGNGHSSSVSQSDSSIGLSIQMPQSSSSMIPSSRYRSMRFS